MLIELIYYAADRKAGLENRLAQLGETEINEGQSRKEFLMALSGAFKKSDTVIAVGSLADLSKALSKGLGLELEPVDWDALGIEGAVDALLPKGALPLMEAHCVCGMILECDGECIIAVDSADDAVEKVYVDYIAPYIEALNAPEPLEQPVEDTEPVAPQEQIATEETKPADDNSQNKNEVIEGSGKEYNIFADMTDEDIDFLDEKPKKKSALVAVICVVLAVLLVAAGGFFIYKNTVSPDKTAIYYAELMKQHGKSGDSDKLPEQFNSTYLTRFGALYLINSDVIGTITIPELDINLPIVSAASKGKDYYASHRFDGSIGIGGTPYIVTGYGEDVSNPNLIVYGQNTGATFGRLEELLKSDKAATVVTDSILYGEDDWEIISAMLVDSTSEYDYTDNFANADSEKSVIDTVKKALRLSKVDFGFVESDFDNVGLTSNFLTLVVPYSADESKTVVVVARKAADATIGVSEPTESDGPVESEPTESE